MVVILSSDLKMMKAIRNTSSNKLHIRFGKKNILVTKIVRFYNSLNPKYQFSISIFVWPNEGMTFANLLLFHSQTENCSIRNFYLCLDTKYAMSSESKKPPMAPHAYCSSISFGVGAACCSFTILYCIFYILFHLRCSSILLIYV